MRKLGALVIIVIFAVARNSGLGQPIAGKISMLHLVDCNSPCWISISPGKTSIAEAYKYVTQLYSNENLYQLTQTYSGFRIANKNDGDEFEVSFDYWKGEKPEDRHFYEIKFVSFNRIITLPELFQTLGVPTLIRPASSFPSNRYSTLFFLAHNVRVIIEKSKCDAVSIDAPIIEIDFYSIQESDLTYALAWKGFNVCYNRTS